jgi:hypothetical protein
MDQAGLHETYTLSDNTPGSGNPGGTRDRKQRSENPNRTRRNTPPPTRSPPVTAPLGLCGESRLVRNPLPIFEVSGADVGPRLDLSRDAPTPVLDESGENLRGPLDRGDRDPLIDAMYLFGQWPKAHGRNTPADEVTRIGGCGRRG